jgi:hypothetical protein
MMMRFHYHLLRIKFKYRVCTLPINSQNEQIQSLSTFACLIIYFIHRIHRPVKRLVLSWKSEKKNSKQFHWVHATRYGVCKCTAELGNLLEFIATVRNSPLEVYDVCILATVSQRLSGLCVTYGLRRQRDVIFSPSPINDWSHVTVTYEARCVRASDAAAKFTASLVAVSAARLCLLICMSRLGLTLSHWSSPRWHASHSWYNSSFSLSNSAWATRYMIAIKLQSFTLETIVSVGVWNALRGLEEFLM